MCPCNLMCSEPVKQEFRHLKADWWWLLLFGVLLAVCGVVSLVFPVLTTFATVLILGVALMIGGIASMIASFWTGRWSGMLGQLLVGIRYLGVGYMITEKPLQADAMMTLFIAAFCIVVGIFRVVASLTFQFPYWGWALLNGGVTFLLGMIIYRHFPESALWVIGLLVGLEMLLHGWTWIVLSLAVKQIPDEPA